MTDPDLTPALPSDACVEQAVDWLLRLQDAPDSAALRTEFEAWHAASDAHRSAWDKACASWRLIGEVPPVHEDLWRPVVQPPANVIPLRRRPSLRMRVAGLATAAAVAGLMWLAGPGVLLRMQADHMTQTAELRQVTLADGSHVTLGGHSALAVDMGGDQRRIRLLEGEAFFDEAPDATRPFIVEAGGVEARVLGTKFDVLLDTQTTRIELAEGSLQVSGAGNPVLVPGDSVTVQHGSGAITRTQIAPEDIAAWREGRIFVVDTPISAVIGQIRRYHPAWISVTDGSLGAERVTGLYDLREPDRALRALVQPYGGRVWQVSPLMAVVTR